MFSSRRDKGHRQSKNTITLGIYIYQYLWAAIPQWLDRLSVASGAFPLPSTLWWSQQMVPSNTSVGLGHMAEASSRTHGQMPRLCEKVGGL